MIKNIDTENRELILWDFVPLSDYQLPASPVAEAAQKGITFFTRLACSGIKIRNLCRPLSHIVNFN